MELPELSNLQNCDSPQKRDSYRTSKPPDRCVISYNFQQTNSFNFTHNLLIGMFNDKTKKPTKNTSFNSLDNSKNKLFSILPHPKKIFRQQPSTISKAYESKIIPKRYINLQTASKDRSQNFTYHQNTEKSQYSDCKSKTNKEAFFEKVIDDYPIDKYPNVLNPSRTPFDEEKEREKSPYYTKHPKNHQKFANKQNKDLLKEKYSKLDSHSFQNERSNQTYRGNKSKWDADNQIMRAKVNTFEDLMKNNQSQNNNSLKINNKQSRISKRNHDLSPLRQSQDDHETKQQIQNQNSSTNNEKQIWNTQLKKQNNPKQMKQIQKLDQTQNRNTIIKNNQIQPNQQITKQQNLLNNQQIVQNNKLPIDQLQLTEPLIKQNPTSAEKIKSKKQIQDQQIKQIEEIVRKQQSNKFKKGNFKVNSKLSKEIFPFTLDVQPITNSINKGSYKKVKPNYSQHKEGSNNNVSNTNLQGNNLRNTTGFLLNNNKTNNLKRKNQTGSQLNNSKKSKGKEEILNNKIGNSDLSKDNQTNQLYQKENTKQQKNIRINDQKTSSSNNLKENPNSKYFQTKNISRRGQAEKKRQNKQQSKYKSQQKNGKQKTVLNQSKKIPVKEKQQDIKELKDQTHQDLTQNNVIKGFRIPQKLSKILHKNDSILSNLDKKNSNLHKNTISNQQQLQKSSSKENRSNNSQKNINLDNQLDTNYANRVNQDPQNKKKSSQKSRGENTYSRNTSNIQESISNRRSNIGSRQSKDTARTMKINNRIKPSNSMDNNQRLQSQEGRRQSRTQQSGSRSPRQPTIPRNSKEKDFYFKNWKQSQLQKAQKKAKQSKMQRQSRNKISQKTSLSPNSLRTNKKKSKSKEIDLDAEQEDKFGLLSTKNVAMQKNKSLKKQIPKQRNTKDIKQKKDIEQIQEESQVAGKTNSQNDESLNKSVNDQKNQIQLLNDHINQRQGTNNPNHTTNEILINTNNTQEYSKPQIQYNTSNGIRLQTKTQGIQEMDHLIEQNGALSRIISQNQIQQIAKQQQLQIQRNPQSEEEKCLSNIPSNRKQNNLQDLLIATQQVKVPNKHLQPLLNDVEVQLGKQESKNDLEESKLNKNIQSSFHNPNEQQMAVNLPIPLFSLREEGVLQKKSSRKGVQNQTDYHQQIEDKMNDIPLPDILKEQNNKSSDFFQFNIKQNSKMSDTINRTANITKYEHIDKDTNHYSRAPILSFIYQIPESISNLNIDFSPSRNETQILKNIKQCQQIGQYYLDQAVNILISIDPWIIKRIFQPFQDKNQKIGVWLYCHGKWTLFQQDKQKSFRMILNKVTNKAIQLLKQRYDLQTLLRLISGVRIMRLKSNKKKIFNQLQYSLKKGHTLKALTSKESRWGQRLFQVAMLEVTKQNQNVLQIKEKNDRYWIKQAKFKQFFQHFLLICTRKSHFWTNRIIENKSSHKTVIELSSALPAHGSITLFYPSELPSSLLLYKQLQTKVLKFMGKIENKINQNGNLYFEFRLHGTYSLFLQTPADCLLAIQATNQLQIGEPEYILSQTLKNSDCEYVEINNTKLKSKPKGQFHGNETLEHLRSKFINSVIKKR